MAVVLVATVITLCIVFICGITRAPVTVAPRSKACTALVRAESSLVRKLGSWVLTPRKAWMFGMCMCLFCVCVALCLGRDLATS
jgi:hypothetical protein